MRYGASVYVFTIAMNGARIGVAFCVAPFFFFAVGMALGIFLIHTQEVYIGSAYVWLGVILCGLCIGGLYLRMAWFGVLCIGLFSVCLGGMLSMMEKTEARRRGGFHLLSPDYYRAYAVSWPKRMRDVYGYTMHAKVNGYIGSGGFHGVENGILLRIYAQRFPFDVGEEFWVSGGNIKPISDGDSYGAHLLRQGIYYEQLVSSADMVGTGREKGSMLWRLGSRMRLHIERNLRTALSEPWRGIALAVLLGDKQEVDKKHMEVFSAAGAMHLFAVSGLHIGLWYLLCIFLLFPVRYWRGTHSLPSVCALCLTWGFAFMLGFPVSIQRAWWMLLLFVLGGWIYRRSSSLNRLGIAAVGILLFQPVALFTLSFQLSFLAVFGILCFYEFFYQRWGESFSWGKRFVVSPLAVTFSAQLTTQPLTLYYFHFFPLYALLSNLWLIPMLFLLLPCVMVVGVWGSVWGLAPLTESLLIFFHGSAKFITDLPYSHLYPLYFTKTQILLSYTLCILFLGYLWFSKRVWIRYAIIGVLCLFSLSVWMGYRRSFVDTSWRIFYGRASPLVLYLDKGRVWASDLSQLETHREANRALIAGGYLHAFGDHPLLPFPWQEVVKGSLYGVELGKKKIFWMRGRLDDPRLLEEIAMDYLVLDRQVQKNFSVFLPHISSRTCIIVSDFFDVLLPDTVCIHVLSGKSALVL